MDYNFDYQMSLSKSKCLYSNNCLHFSKCVVPFHGYRVHRTSKNVEFTFAKLLAAK